MESGVRYQAEQNKRLLHEIRQVQTNSVTYRQALQNQ
jgi:hypothetical protein